MSLKDELDSALGRRRFPCRTRDLAAALGEDDRQAFLDAVSDLDVPLKVISRVMADRGMPISTDSLRKHRQKGCSCEPQG